MMDITSTQGGIVDGGHARICRGWGSFFVDTETKEEYMRWCFGLSY